MYSQSGTNLEGTQCEVSTLKWAMAFFFQILFYSLIFAIVSYNICSLKIVLK